MDRTPARPQPKWPPESFVLPPRPAPVTGAAPARSAQGGPAAARALRRPLSLAISHPASPPTLSAIPPAPLTASISSSLFPVPYSLLYSRQPRHAHRQLRFNHFELGPRQLHIPRRQRQVVAVIPLRLNDGSRLERQKMPHAKLPDRHGHVQFHRQSRHQRPEPRLLLVLAQLPRRGNQRCPRVAASSIRLSRSSRTRPRRCGMRAPRNLRGRRSRSRSRLNRPSCRNLPTRRRLPTRRNWLRGGHRGSELCSNGSRGGLGKLEWTKNCARTTFDQFGPGATPPAARNRARAAPLRTIHIADTLGVGKTLRLSSRTERNLALAEVENHA